MCRQFCQADPTDELKIFGLVIGKEVHHHHVLVTPLGTLDKTRTEYLSIKPLS